MNPFIAYVTAGALALGLLSDAALGNGTDATYQVRVLGCKLPVPAQYVLNATSERGIVMIHEAGAGQIYIAKFKGIPERLEVMSERTAGRLTVAEVAFKSEGRAPDSMVIIRDQEYAVSLIGEAKALVPTFLDACAAASE